jgi:hypothetical protein
VQLLKCNFNVGQPSRQFRCCRRDFERAHPGPGLKGLNLAKLEIRQGRCFEAMSKFEVNCAFAIFTAQHGPILMGFSRRVWS